MGISWKDKISNERVGAQTELEKINLIIKERRPKWLGHVLRRDGNRLRRQPVLEYSGTRRTLVCRPVEEPLDNNRQRSECHRRHRSFRRRLCFLFQAQGRWHQSRHCSRFASSHLEQRDVVSVIVSSGDGHRGAPYHYVVSDEVVLIRSMADLPDTQFRLTY